jgi:hypothetical protein
MDWKSRFLAIRQAPIGVIAMRLALVGSMHAEVMNLRKRKGHDGSILGE